MANDCHELKELNQATFDAEEMKKIGDDSWDDFLRKVLAGDFIIRRSNPAVPNQNREEMIAWIESHPPATRNLLTTEILAWWNETLGVVIGPVIMNDHEGKLRRYQNIKVFQKRQTHWKCIYWQVTEAPAQ